MNNNNLLQLFISSPAFANGGDIPTLYTCEGENFNPSLIIEKIPERTRSLAIIMEDPDARNGVFDHWLAWNIPVGPVQVDSDAGISGINGAGKSGYHGPCPPYGSHRYFFYVYALDTMLNLPQGSTKNELRFAMANHIIASGTLMGKYFKILETVKSSHQAVPK